MQFVDLTPEPEELQPEPPPTPPPRIVHNANGPGGTAVCGRAARLDQLQGGVITCPWCPK
jgi:hypothetical protein